MVYGRCPVRVVCYARLPFVVSAVEDHRFKDAVYALTQVNKLHLDFYTCSSLTYFILEVI